jgi:phospholipase C
MMAISSNRQKIQFCETKNLNIVGACVEVFISFLTGSDSQTEIAVTRRKQSPLTILTGSRIDVFRSAMRGILRLHHDIMAGSQLCNFLRLAFLRSCRLYGAADKPRSQWRIQNMRRVFAILLAGMMLNPGMLGAAPPPPSSVKAATPIKHLVVIFQENVSFDHYFGVYPVATNPSGEPKFKAAAGTPTVNGFSNALLNNNPNLNPLNLAGATNPFRLDRSQAATSDQDHDYTPEQAAFDGGLMDLFPLNTGTPGPPPGAPPIADTTGLVMGYYDGNTVTALWNYAQHYAMSDNSYDTNFGPSTPGAINLVSGQTNGVIQSLNGSGSIVPDGNGGFTLNSDADPVGDVCSTSSGETVQMGGQNIGNLLNAAGVSWGFFEGGFNLSIVNSNGSTGCSRSTTSAITATKKADYIPHHQPFQYYVSTANPTHARPSSVKLIGQQGDGANHQYDILDFYAAIRAGNFPAVSFLKAPGFQDGHAGYSDPLDEQTFIVDVINFLQGQPEWANTAVVINYDDSDGWYDHQLGQIVNTSAVPLADVLTNGSCGSGATALPGINSSTLHAQGRCGYGPRLPYMVISPWARRNFVDHTMTDQSSTIRFIEDNWLDGQRIGNGSFDTIANSITQMFDFKQVDDNDLFILNDKTGEVEFSSSSN